MEPKLKQEIDAYLDKQLGLRIPHTCSTCERFQLSKKPPRNRNCTYPHDLTIKDFDKGRCMKWVLGKDLSMRRPKNITV